MWGKLIRPEYFKLNKIINGKNNTKIDMINIRQEYKSLFNRSLSDDLKAELSGHFEDIVLKLIGKNS